MLEKPPIHKRGKISLSTNAKVLDFKLDFSKRRFIESYFINQIPNAVNDKQNDKFPSIYSDSATNLLWGLNIVFHTSPFCHFFVCNLSYFFLPTNDSFCGVIFLFILRWFKLRILALTKIGSTCPEHNLSKRWQKVFCSPVELLNLRAFFGLCHFHNFGK